MNTWSRVNLISVRLFNSIGINASKSPTSEDLPNSIISSLLFVLAEEKNQDVHKIKFNQFKNRIAEVTFFRNKKWSNQTAAKVSIA